MVPPTASPTRTGADLPAGAAPSELGADLALQHPGGWLRWSRFSYELPSDHAGRRRTIWRQLRAIQAIKLQPGEWAMAHDETGLSRLDRLISGVRAAGGSAVVHEVGRSGVDEVEAQVRLVRCCEALWDPFFNGADRVERARSGDLTVADVDRLRLRYAEEIAGDVVLSDAARRAADRLDELAARTNVEADDPAGTPARVEIGAAWALDNGDVRYVAQLQPFPSLATERAFHEFEARVYQPSPHRIPLRHGVFLFTATPEARDATLASLRHRLSAFASLQG